MSKSKNESSAINSESLDPGPSYEEDSSMLQERSSNEEPDYTESREPNSEEQETSQEGVDEGEEEEEEADDELEESAETAHQNLETDLNFKHNDFSPDSLEESKLSQYEAVTPELMMKTSKLSNAQSSPKAQGMSIFERFEDNDKVKLNTLKRNGWDISFGQMDNVKLDRVEHLAMDIRAGDNESDEELVYPLSVKYNRRKDWINKVTRYIILIVLLILLIPWDLYSMNYARKSSVRVGYFADIETDKSFGISGVSEFKFNIKNCRTHLIENTDSSSSVQFYASHSRDTDIDTNQADGVVTVSVDSDTGAPFCFAEIKIPGGVEIEKITINFDGGDISDQILFDYKEGDVTWGSPMKVNTFQIVVSESYPVVKFTNAHEIGNLIITGSFCACSFDTVKIKEMTYDITVGTLYINQNSVYAQNKITASTPYGTHCVAAATVNADEPDNCPDDEARTAGISSTSIDTTSMCTVAMFACSSSSCPAYDATSTDDQGSFTITLDDGPIQFLIDGSDTTASNTYNPYTDTFAVTSQATLANNKEEFSSIEHDARIYLYEVISPDYEKMWVHSSLKQYIHARPWLLSILSWSILRPKYIRQTLVHIPGNRCPLVSSNDVQQNTYIREKLYALSYTDSNHIFALKIQKDYYEYELTSEGDFKEYKVPFLTGNLAVLLCVIFSIILAVFSVVMVFILLIRIRKIVDRLTRNMIKKARKFARAKREIQRDHEDQREHTIKKSRSMRTIKVLHKNLFYVRLVKKELEINDKRLSALTKENRTIRLTLFKAPVLYYDYYTRSRYNGFKAFLDNIRESTEHFPAWKLNSNDYWSSTSVRLDLIDHAFREYCTKEGYKPVRLEDQTDIINQYNLKLVYKVDSNTQVYTHIRWKSLKEKQETAKVDNEDQAGEETANSVSQFLKSECIQTSFETDIILVSNLRDHYNDYCNQHKIDDLLKINIVGCTDLETFGARFNSNMLIPYISGLALVHTLSKHNEDWFPGIVRIPKFSKARENSASLMRRFGSTLRSLLLGDTGLLFNFLVVASHLAFLIAVPLLLIIAFIWSLQQIELIDDDIYDVRFELSSVFSPSYYDFWLDDLPALSLFWVMFTLCWMFFITGLIELLSFYATEARDTGKYPVERSIFKTISLFSFWMMFSVFIALYSAYFLVTCVWWILGAIISPERFLPVATGAAVLLVFIYSLYHRLKSIERSMQELVNKIVDGEIRSLMMNTFGNHTEKIEEKLKKSYYTATTKSFHKIVNSCLCRWNFPLANKQTTDAILNGDMQALIDLMHENFGISRGVALALIGFVREDNTLIIDSIYKLSNELGLDTKFSWVMAELILNKYNPYASGINKVTGKTVSTVKKVFRVMFPHFPLEAVETILQLVFEGDPKPLEYLIKKLKIPDTVYKMSLTLAQGKEEEMHYIIEDIKDILAPHYRYLYEALYSVYKGDLDEKVDALANCLNIQHEYVMSIIVGCLKVDPDSTTYALNNALNKIFEHEMKDSVQKNKVEVVRSYLLSLQLLSKKVYCQLWDYVKEYQLNIKIENAWFMTHAWRGFAYDINIVWAKLGLLQQSKIIYQYLSLWMRKDESVILIADKMGIRSYDYDKFSAILRFSIATATYFARILPVFDEKQKDNNGRPLKDKAWKELSNNIVHNEIKDLLWDLYSLRAVDPPEEHFIVEAFKGLYERGKKIHQTVEEELAKVLRGDQNWVKRIINETLDKLDWDREKKNYFKALWIVATAFVNHLTLNDLPVDEKYEDAFKMVAAFLEIYDETRLEFLLDLVTNNPYRILKCSTQNPKIDLNKKQVIAKFEKSRIGIWAEVLECSKYEIRKLAAVWLYNYKNIMAGEQSMRRFASEVLHISPTFIEIIYIATNHELIECHKFEENTIRDLMIDFLDDELYRAEKRGDQSTQAPFLNEEVKEYNEVFKDKHYDSPFDKELREERDVNDYIKLCQIMLKATKAKTNTLKELFEVDDEVAEVTSAVWRAIKSQNFESYIQVLAQLSDIMANTSFEQTFQQMTNAINETGTKASGKLKKMVKKSTLNQEMFLQICLLLTVNKLNDHLVESKSRDRKLESQIKDLIDIINEYLPSEKLLASSMTHDDVFSSIFQSGFFEDIAKYLFHVVVKDTKSIQNPQAILGLIVGITLRNNALIRYNLPHLLSNRYISSQYLNGLVGLITKDLAYETDINALCKKINIKGNLAIDLIKLIMNRKDIDKYTAAYSISSLVSIMKKDLSSSHILCDYLRLDTELMSALIAWAAKRIDLLDKNYKNISDNLGIGSEDSLRSILEIGAGYHWKAYHFNHIKNWGFNIRKPSVLSSLMIVIKSGTEIIKKDRHLYDTHVEGHWKEIARELTEGFGFTSDEAKTNADSDQQPRMDDEVNDSSEKFQALFVTLTKACWGDSSSLVYLKEALNNSLSNINVDVESIWHKYPQKMVIILKKKLREVFTDAKKEIERIDLEAQKDIEANKRYLSYLDKHATTGAYNQDSDDDEKKTEFEVTSEDATEQAIIHQLEESTDKAAFKIGCTFRISKFRPMKQKVYLCYTCRDKAKKDVVVCLSCVRFWHNGHNVSLHRDGEKVPEVCSWGPNQIQKIERVTDENPLAEIEGASKLYPDKCWLMKDSVALPNRFSSILPGGSLLNKSTNIKRFKTGGLPEDDSAQSDEGEEMDDLDDNETEPDLEEGESENDEINENSKDYFGEASSSSSDSEESRQFDRQEFRDDLADYESKDLIKDLMKALHLDTRKSHKSILEQNFMIFDESLNRPVHIFEQIILLAHGYCRPGLLKLVANKEPLSQDNIDKISLPFYSSHDQFFSAMMTFVTAYQNELDQFERYNIGFLEGLRMKTTKTYTVSEKAVDMLLILHGDQISKSNSRDSTNFSKYKSIFQRLFNKGGNRAMCLHKLATMDEEDVIALFNAAERSWTGSKTAKLQRIHSLLVDTFMRMDLDLDEDSLEWLSGLSRVSMSQLEGFSYICKEYGISNSKSNIYKAICTRNVKLMNPLFRAVDPLIPFATCLKIGSIFNYNMKEARNLIISACKNRSDGLEHLLERICKLVQLDNMSFSDLKLILNDIRVDTNMGSIFHGFNSLLNNDCVGAIKIFEYEHLKRKLNNKPLLEAVVFLVGKRWEDQHVKILIEHISKKKSLFAGGNQEYYISKLIDRVDFNILKNFIRVSEGDVVRLARVMDWMAYSNKSMMCTLIATMACGYSAIDNIKHYDDFEEANKILKIDIERLIKYLFKLAQTDEKFEQTMDYYKLHNLFAALNFTSLDLMYVFFTQEDLYGFYYKNDEKNREVIMRILDLVRKNKSIPSLESIFKAAAPNLTERHPENKRIVEVNGEYMLKLKNLSHKLSKTAETVMSTFEHFETSLFESNEDLEESNDYNYPNFDHYFKYKVSDGGLKISAPRFFNLALYAGYDNEGASLALMKILIPLYRDIPCAREILKIGLDIAEGRKEDILETPYSLIKIVLLDHLFRKIEPKIDKYKGEAEESLEKDVKKILDSFKIRPKLFKTMAICIESILRLLNKNVVDRKFEEFEEICQKIWEGLVEYALEELEDANIKPENVHKQVEFLLYIIGVCRGNFELAAPVAKTLGFFNPENIREITNIMNRFKDIIFEGNVFNLPSLTYVADSLNSMGGDYDKFESIISGVMQSTKQELQTKTTGIISNITNISESKVDSMANIASDVITRGPLDAVFLIMFRKFDQDESNFIDFQEFRDITKFFGLDLDRERALEMFALADRNSSQQLDLSEFKEALLLINKTICYETLQKLGLTVEDLIWIGVLALLFLIQLFIIIFLGIYAFSQTNDFNAVVNSLLPLGAGLLAAARRADIKDYVDKVKGYVQDIIARAREI